MRVRPLAVQLGLELEQIHKLRVMGRNVRLLKSDLEPSAQLSNRRWAMAGHKEHAGRLFEKTNWRFVGRTNATPTAICCSCFARGNSSHVRNGRTPPRELFKATEPCTQRLPSRVHSYFLIRTIHPSTKPASRVSGRPLFRKAGIAYLRICALRSAYATRLSAGGVADELSLSSRAKAKRKCSMTIHSQLESPQASAHSSPAHRPEAPCPSRRVHEMPVLRGGTRGRCAAGHKALRVR